MYTTVSLYISNFNFRQCSNFGRDNTLLTFLFFRSLTHYFYDNPDKVAGTNARIQTVPIALQNCACIWFRKVQLHNKSNNYIVWKMITKAEFGEMVRLCGRYNAAQIIIALNEGLMNEPEPED